MADKNKNIKISKRFKKWQPPQIEHGKPTRWNWLVLYPKGLKLGRYTDIGAYTLLMAKYGVKIEDYVEIGSHCSIYSQSTIDHKQAPVLLKKNCKIGTHSSVMPGVTIGKNSIVGAHSFVNKNIPSNEIWAGCPVRFLRKLNKKKF